ncbi:collagen alpha-2(I) chain-like [Vanessa cardui]|uniref:collagen alpha-2(I) chain-like n=1 Tax=Vanessa cardui TaxID=171605 RepID=UPI001F13B74D|nr:collagen alpha-2(I) chain-like [Vanessa cardui]
MLGRTLCGALLLATVSYSGAERWSWPDAAAEESVRIDSKVRFVDAPETRRNNKRDNVQADEIPFEEATDTEGFYNRPPGSGRYPVVVEPERSLRINGQNVYFLNGQNRNQRYSDGTLDSLQHCKCVSRPDCKVQTDYKRACGTNQYLCCFNVPNRQNSQQSEYFNEVDDERPMLYPSQGNLAGPFPAPHESNANGVFGPDHGPNNVLLGSFEDRRPPQNVLVGPDGPTGIIGPTNQQVLVGPGGPTGVVGPGRPILTGPQGPTGVIGPGNENRDDRNVHTGPNRPSGDAGLSETAQRGVLVGPGGPTGIIGPAYNRPVLVGPNGPTGVIGPRRQGVLVGPGGPTGIIGPGGFNRQPQRPGILVGPGGPTGIIGPGRRVLVGPGGPTGQIGPGNYFGK